jgi:hypothetical protein
MENLSLGTFKKKAREEDKNSFKCAGYVGARVRIENK